MIRRYQRFPWANGPIPEGMVVRHTCHTILCVNPHHLIIGTQAENIQDTVNAKRHTHGEGHASAKLTEIDVRRIRHLISQGLTDSEIIKALELGVGKTAVRNIRTGKKWRHV